MFTTFDALLDAVKGMAPLPVAVVDAAEAYVLEAACEAKRRHMIDPILIGNQERIVSILASLPDCPTFDIVNVQSDEQAAAQGVDLVMNGQAQAVMKGHIHSDAFLHPILARLRTKERLSHVFMAELPTYPKLLCVTDAAINITPSLMDKAQIVQNAVDFLRELGVEQPKVACLSAIEVINPQIPSTIDAACLAKMAERGQIRHALVDGPLAFDNAVSLKAAQIKGIQSVVAGDVDILLVPDLVSGNILVKDLEYLAQATLAGIVLGGRVPIILTSRADPPRARLVSAALAVLMHNRSQVTAI
ncbi:bifunctional enoyl-CoA hydratase/phosphate acetyltransferase [Sulfobacillus sp. hq2]|uniref:bifunctional enoyl-CoA hydratase/phosphate acetyltransferase n=1 Tax=Sulfobacillus TaxID=28033 RepID=UPI001A9A55A3|nr:bifunctional enoyl-CoA hydratase/phosphate acetyltransferase [Sulfobacillus sp. hq2]